jgi:hypothetical protein
MGVIEPPPTAQTGPSGGGDRAEAALRASQPAFRCSGTGSPPRSRAEPRAPSRSRGRTPRRERADWNGSGRDAGAPATAQPTGNDPIQLSFSVAHDAAAELLYAQPRTLDEGGAGPTTENFVASYDEATGADLDWWAIEDLDFSAGGIAVLADDGSGSTRLLMGQGSELFVFDTGTDELTPLAGVSSAGVTDIGGLAIDREQQTLLLADPGALEVVEVRLDALGL